MNMLYDTRAIRPLDRYDHYRAGAGAELAPVTIHGRAPAHLLAVMSIAQIGYPRALVPIASDKVHPLIGTLIPRSMP
ncbi:MAG TPA: hypothetical protein VFO16_09685, partial [Pseudonocardiaceae bacterium]|nr:hypothetical protein [Pseudonocardiaceae bacterium]